MICSVVGAADGDGDGVADLFAVTGLLVVGADEGAGICPYSSVAIKIAIVVSAAQFHITSLLAARRAESNIATVMATVEMNPRNRFVGALPRGRDGRPKRGDSQNATS